MVMNQSNIGRDDMLRIIKGGICSDFDYQQANNNSLVLKTEVLCLYFKRK